MDRLLDAARRNPDAIAIAVLCLVLGFGRQAPALGSAAMSDYAPAGIHRLCLDALENAASAMQAPFCLPRWLSR